MGSSASKKKKVVQQEAPRSPPKAAVTPQNRPSPSPPPLPAIPSRRSSVHKRSPSTPSRVSAKRSSANLANGIERRTSYHKLNNKTPTESDNASLPPLGNGKYKSISRASRRSSSIAPPPPPPPINQSRMSSESLPKSIKQTDRQGSPSIHEPSGRCSKCPHCQRLNSSNSDDIRTPEPGWITKNPGTDQLRINMDDYDIEAVKKKIISRHHHILGSYDYQPYLTIEQTEGDYDPTKENYFTQPFITKMQPSIEAMRTPFPDYDLLQRRENRLNKPYTLPLFN